jgi:hypothetical protein
MIKIKKSNLKINNLHLSTYFNNQLNAQFFLFYNNMYVTLQSSTCFEHQHAHLQEDKLYITASGIVSLCKWPYRMPDESRLLCSSVLTLLGSGHQKPA